MNTELSNSLKGQAWGLFIDGQSVPAEDESTITIFSPANREPIASIARATANDISKAVETAQAGYKEWAKLTAYQRESIIKKAAAYVRTQADRIGMLMALEQGKPFNQAKAEIIGSCDTIEYFASEAVRVEGYVNQTEKAGVFSIVKYYPVGVCALITPWNYPVSLLSWKLGPALAVGCSVVVKPTTVTPLSPMAFCMALVEGGIPARVISVLTGQGSVVGDVLVKHPLVKKVAMTGSTATGKKLMQTVAPYLKKISLELGGQCPAIVCADADIINAAAVIAYKGFRNMGQSCSSINRVYVHVSKHQSLVAELKKNAEKLTIGDGVTDGAADLGPMATADGITTTKQHIEDAIGKGASLVTGGRAPEGGQYEKGFYFMPTILDNCHAGMKVMQEETFGCVVAVETFETLEEAVNKANDTNYGLVAYAFTKDFKTSMHLGDALEAGTVCVNSGAVNTNYAPYAGWKDSGYGVELSRNAVFEYLETKHIKVEAI
ncbi:MULTISPECIES: aldehyde dehydrogenase [Emticicia]|uniref:aldehyde dehydrogenase family protein n=1 Tax=Emticicia TaxID=312278 RepID=UPI00209F9867|nr:MULTISPECIES: aldehyde dehydrogenase family protein [Emticicia]UTA67929.1 aldehyde dehydrogenase family protein [Emticicia sp. 21SJ11W-3]